jgi:hypothetical protein
LIKIIISQGGADRIDKNNPQLDKKTLQQLRTLIEVLQTVYYARYHRYYLSLKTAYRPFNPDKDVVSNRQWSDEEKRCLQKKLFSEMSALLQKANYDELDESEINLALNNAMSRGLSINAMELSPKLLIFIKISCTNDGNYGDLSPSSFG